MKAIEVSGHIDERSELHLDSALDVVGPSRVKVIILVPEDAEAGETEWLQAAARNPAFAFLHDAEEDIYTLADGTPLRDES